MLGSHTGTHLVPPGYTFTPESARDSSYPPAIQAWRTEFVEKYGSITAEDVTTDAVRLEQGCGPARVIDVTHLLNTTAKASWPASPEITVVDIERHEKQHGALKKGDVVLFRSGWSDRFYRPLPAGKACMDDPLNGKCEGWPAPGADAIIYLTAKGVRCVGTDAPTIAAVNPKQALMTYWTLGGKGMIGVEYLTNLGKVPEGAYFIFAAVKIQGCHGGPGRAIALY
jgi:kynurenine formamidase